MKKLEVAPLNLLLVFSALVSACGGKDSNPPAQVSLSDVPGQLVSTFCSGFGNCCASKGFAFNATACDTNLSGQFTSDEICPATGVYNAQAASDCLAELQAELSSCSTSGNAASACNNICNGTLAPGATCNGGGDCAKSANATVICTPSATSGTTHVCVVFSHGKAGDSCQANCTTVPYSSGPTLVCQYLTSLPTASGTASCFTSDGVYCASNSVCQPLLAVGSPCSNTDVCVDAAYCDTTTNTCLAKIALGASCAPAGSGFCGGACPAPGICVDSAYCSTAQICETKKAGGAACQSTDECSGFCDTNTQLCADYNSTGLYVSATSATCANPMSGN